jgi:hypothetical protein
MRLFLERCRFFVSIKGRGKLRRPLATTAILFRQPGLRNIYADFSRVQRTLNFVVSLSRKGCAEGRVAQDRQKIRIVLFDGSNPQARTLVDSARDPSDHALTA